MTPVVRAATTACCIAAGVCSVSLWRMSRPIVLPQPERMPAPDMAIAPVPRRTMPADFEVATALDHDPFAPDRHRPTTRYQLPEDLAAAAAAPATPAGLPHLLGTVVSPRASASFAMCQVGSEPPRMVRVGDMVNGLRLERVSQGAALFLSATGSRIELSAVKGSGS
jgi:hypothetical protein